MTNAELVEYAKNQLQAGSSANYIRTVLIKQGWGERDVDDAIAIAQTEVGAAGERVPVTAATEAAVAGPATPGGKSKSLILAGFLTGLYLVITSGVSISTLITRGEILAAMEAAGAGTGSPLILTWVLAIIGLIAGIFWIIVAIKELTK